MIARVTVASTLGDENVIVALPVAGSATIRFRALDDERHPLSDEDPLRTADEPLTAGELVALIDSVSLGKGLRLGLVHGILDLNGALESRDPEHADLVGVDSELYPGLSDHYEREIRRIVGLGD